MTYMRRKLALSVAQQIEKSGDAGESGWEHSDLSNLVKKEDSMRTILCIAGLLAVLPILGRAQSGSINNTLGTGGSFKVKSATSDSLLVVKDNGNVGIGTASPGSKLDVNGQLTSDRLKVDGVPSFFATHLEEADLGSGISVLTTWDETVSGSHDNSGSLNSSTGQFVAPRDGFYFLSAHIEISNAGTSGLTLAIKSGFNFTGMQSYTQASGAAGFLSVSGVLKLTSGTAVTVVISKPTAPSNCTAGAGYFSGYLVSDF